MAGERRFLNAFSTEYLEAVRERDEPFGDYGRSAD